MSERMVNVGGTEIWTKRIGEGQPVLFINGGPGCCHYLDPLMEMVSDFCEAITFEPRGCGRSSIGRENYHMKNAIEEIEIIRKAYGFNEWNVIGHSWGADLALAYTIQCPKSVSRFISISGTGIQNDRDWKESYKKNKAEKGEETPEFFSEVNKVVHRSLLDSWRKWIKRSTLLKEISTIDVPALFIFGEDDIRPSWPVEQLSELMKHASFVKIDGAEHYIWMKKQDELNGLVRTFIKNIEN
ncbi:alpha/beta fold hydrolase [Evansella halocellulosilytica]|uniref:alpha/beta fold hydrolase n=1 Tax=Evansella halocellulosilytica TaxID=2011013 RepID=UPI00211B835F|nr:alpha/beta hydrolase [Evansella halocellulosilytica]